MDNKDVCDFVRNFYLNGNAKEAAEELTGAQNTVYSGPLI